MREETKFVLNVIDEYLAKGDAASKELWDVLTALRGPDNESEKVKFTTTAVIRGVAFPKTLEAGCTYEYEFNLKDAKGFGAFFSKATKVCIPSNVDDKISGWHFWSHLRKAATVLEVL